MCDLTTKWIFHLYIGITFYGSGAENYSSLGVRGSDAQKGAACSYMTLYSKGSSASSTHQFQAIYTFRTLGSGETQTCGMLIDDPLGEGSNASSTSSELWRAENSFSE